MEKRERERERERETETDRDRDRDRQTERERETKPVNFGPPNQVRTKTGLLFGSDQDITNVLALRGTILFQTNKFTLNYV